MDLRRVAGWIVILLGSVGMLVVAPLLVLELSRSSPLWSPFVLFGALLAFGTALAFVLVGRRLALPRVETERVPVRPREVRPVPVVAEADARSLPTPITACPDCGFLGIRMPTIHDGLWPGGGETGARFVCPRCDWQGLPVTFRTPTEYVAFVRDLNEAPRGEVAA